MAPSGAPLPLGNPPASRAPSSPAGRACQPCLLSTQAPWQPQEASSGGGLGGAEAGPGAPSSTGPRQTFRVPPGTRAAGALRVHHVPERPRHHGGRASPWGDGGLEPRAAGWTRTGFLAPRGDKAPWARGGSWNYLLSCRGWGQGLCPPERHCSLRTYRNQPTPGP